MDPWRNSCSSSWKVFSWNTVRNLETDPMGSFVGRQVERRISEKTLLFFFLGGGVKFTGVDKKNDLRIIYQDSGLFRNLGW